MQVRQEHKSDAAFRTISEVSDDLGIPQHVLRFWESRFAQIQPMKSKGGRRYYRPEDVDVLRRIKTLLYSQGYTIKGAQKVVNFPEGVKRITAVQKEESSTDLSPEENLTKVSEKLIHNLERASTSSRRKQQSELQDVLKDLYRMRDLLKKMVAAS